ncbi:MAG: dephospho-CoA kinase [Parashewanella sp.]
MNKFVVGLTGGIGSGKTTVANLFAKQGIELVDADIVAREIVEPNSQGLTQIIEHFGSKIVDETGRLDRQTLRNIIFSNPEEKQWLNQCLHPKIRNRMLELIKNSTSAYTVLVVPLLFENKLDKLVQRTLVVDIPLEQQVKRTAIRDNVDNQQVQNIINSQMTRDERISKADDIIDNQGQIATLEHEVLALHKLYLTLSAKLKSEL